jgi:hypothetical protein
MAKIKKMAMYPLKTVIVFLLIFVVFTPLLPTASAAERVYFTSDRASSPGKIQTQVFSMNAEGGDVRQHTSSVGTKANTYRCGSNGPIFFQNEDTLALLNAHEKEEKYLSTKGIQYHSPRCSTDTRYLSVTAWDKVNEKGYIEVYERATKRRVARWEGEEASWMRGHHMLVYKLLVRRNEEEKIDILMRDLNKPAAAPLLLFSHDIGEYVYNISEPQFIGQNASDVVFRVYDEHEYFYYLGKPGKSFVLTRDKALLSHHNVYAEEHGPSLEQAQFTPAPDGKYAVFTEHPWNTPPSLYMFDLRTRDSWKIAEGYNPVWSGDASRIYFNKDPTHYLSYHNALKRNIEFREIYPDSLDGYEIYVYDLARKQEKRLTNNLVYDGFK